MPSPKVLLFRSIISFVNLKHMARLLPGRALMWPCSRSGRDPHNDKSQMSSICLHAKCGSHSVTRYFVPHAGSSWSALIWCGDMNSRTERTYVSPTLSSNPLRRSEQRIELKEFITIKKIDAVYSSRLITRRRTRAGRNPIDCSPTQ